jgi:hypothetical protein
LACSNAAFKAASVAESIPVKPSVDAMCDPIDSVLFRV